MIKGPLKLEKIEVMQGANYFSGGPVVLLRLDLGSYDEVFTDQIPGFYEKLSKILPTLFEHYCSVGKPGGFFIRVKEGTLLGHVCEHIAIELQTLAGMDVAYGKTRSTLEQGVYNIIFRFFDEVCGVYAGKAAINIVNSLLSNKTFDVFEVIENLVHIREDNLPGPSTQSIIDETNKRNIPSLRLDSYNLIQLGTGKYQKRIRATITSDTSLIAVETADNKHLSYIMLNDAGIPVAETIKANTPDDILSFRKKNRKSIVVKPNDAYLGKNSMLDINTKEEITQAFDFASEFDKDIIAQAFIKGKSYRLLVIDYKFVAATELIPPIIIGDGKHDIKQLISDLNKDPERQYGDKAKLSKVEVDIVTERIFNSKNYSLDTILPKGEKLILKNSGNPKFGGTSIDVTEKAHEYNRFIAERVAHVIGLNVAGVDIITKDIAIPIDKNEGKVIEVNAAPDFRMHINPAIGKKRDVANDLLNMLFPLEKKNRIPVFSVTGTAGKTIAVSLLDYCLKNAGYVNGYTTSEGLYISGHRLKSGDMTYPEYAKFVLKDPTIECAILETSSRGILQQGLGYSYADYGIVLNIKDDNVGMNDIKYIEDLAYVKSVVAEQVYEDGYAILNADYELILEMRERVYSKLALFSTNANNPEIAKLIAKKGLAVYIENNTIYISNRGKTSGLILINDIPLTKNKNHAFIIESLLGTITALTAHGLTNEQIRKSLSTFSN
ncbi:MAG: cyanophycin synthetase [Bacteroidales bacterium]|nr:cyanophycin synthetase [Bacteroidales bacterium]